MKTVLATLPAYWAYFLFENDKSGLPELEVNEIEAWLERSDLHRPCLSVSDEPFFSWRNEATKVGGECLEYTFAA